MSEFKGVGVQPEFPVVLIITIVLLLGGVVAFSFGNFSSFNFYFSKIDVNGTSIHEELHFNPDQDYHALFRNFVSPIYWVVNNEGYVNSAVIYDVQCSGGEEYVRDYSGNCYNSDGIFPCYPYTENNEYGCSYGDTLGFTKGKEYVINSEYEIRPVNLFRINNNYYIKFVVYSPKNHVKLSNKNFIVAGDVVKDKKYLPNENVVLYIPYKGDISNYTIINQNGFKFDSGSRMIALLLSLIPGIFFFIVWFVFGREKAYEETPKELSTFPNKRKFWEVSAYFNPPFFRIDKNLFASVLLNFYNNKIIDIKEKGKEIYVKLNKFEGDKIEKEIYDIIEFIQLNLRKDKDNELMDGDYFNLKKFMKSFYYANVVNPLLLDRFKELREDVKEGGKVYFKENTALRGIFLTLFVVIFLFGLVTMNPLTIGLYVLTIVLITSLFMGAIFSRFNGEYYIEYQKWKAFKRYLKNSFSITSATHKTVVIWNEYLIYATALGVPEKVIKELRVNNLINENQNKMYTGITSGMFFNLGALSASASGMGGGGFGGAGGGGVGGGGGGGR